MRIDGLDTVVVTAVLGNVFRRGSWRLLAARKLDGDEYAAVFRSDSGTVVEIDRAVLVAPSGAGALPRLVRDGGAMAAYWVSDGWVHCGVLRHGWPQDWLNFTCAVCARLNLEDLAE